MITAGILGASGYMGGEALRVLLEHPQVKVAWATSRAAAAVEDYHPNLYESGVELIHPDEAEACDVVFLALPADAAMPQAQRFLDLGCKVIDLGAAFRLADRAVWERVYRQTHTHWELAMEAVYGIPELHGEEIAVARLIANPGCFASAAILGLAPLLIEDLIDERHIFIDGLSGTAGAGAELARAAHHPEIGENLIPYNVVDHRHSYEMEQELSALADSEIRVHFTPVYVPIVRGILDVCHVLPKEELGREELLEIYRNFYRQEPFVKAYDCPKEADAGWQYRPYPWVSAVAGTNYCFIGMEVDERRGRLVVFSALDSLGKGGAHVGVENMNLMFGLERSAGLGRRALHPA